MAVQSKVSDGPLPKVHPMTTALLTAFGAAAVTFMVVMYALEGTHDAFVWPLPAAAFSPVPTASWHGPGPLV